MIVPLLLHCLFELFFILFLHSFMHIHCVWVWVLFKCHQWIRLYLLIFCENVFEADNFPLYVADSTCFNFMSHHFHMLHFIINFCLWLQIWVDFLCFRMLLDRFLCWTPYLYFIYEAYCWVPMYLMIRCLLMIWNWFQLQPWLCPLCIFLFLFMMCFINFFTDKSCFDIPLWF